MRPSPPGDSNRGHIGYVYPAQLAVGDDVCGGEASFALHGEQEVAQPLVGFLRACREVYGAAQHVVAVATAFEQGIEPWATVARSHDESPVPLALDGVDDAVHEYGEHAACRLGWCVVDAVALGGGAS